MLDRIKGKASLQAKVTEVMQVFGCFSGVSVILSTLLRPVGLKQCKVNEAVVFLVGVCELQTGGGLSCRSVLQVCHGSVCSQ